MSERAPRILYDRASQALDAAHKACFHHPDRGAVGMSHGPFSGVNVALGIIAGLEESNYHRGHEIDRLRSEVAAYREALDKAGIPVPEILPHDKEPER